MLHSNPKDLALPEPARTVEKCHQFCLRSQSFEDYLELVVSPDFYTVVRGRWETEVSSYGTVPRQLIVKKFGHIGFNVFSGCCVRSNAPLSYLRGGEGLDTFKSSWHRWLPTAPEMAPTYSLAEKNNLNYLTAHIIPRTEED